MSIFSLLIGRSEDVLSHLLKIIPALSKTQNAERRRLLSSLADICGTCDETFSHLLSKLRPVKNAYSDADQLAFALRDFAGDPEIRSRFSQHHLCGQIDSLIDDMRNSLATLKYSIAVNRIDQLQSSLHEFDRFDRALFVAFEEFARELDQLATDIQQGNAANSESAKQVAVAAIDEFTDRVFRAAQRVNEMKKEALAIAAGV